MAWKNIATEPVEEVEDLSRFDRFKITGYTGSKFGISNFLIENEYGEIARLRPFKGNKPYLTKAPETEKETEEVYGWAQNYGYRLLEATAEMDLNEALKFAEELRQKIIKAIEDGTYKDPYAGYHKNSSENS